MKTEAQEKAKRQQLQDWAAIMNNSADPAKLREASSGIYKAFHPTLIRHFAQKLGSNKGAITEDLAIETLERAFDKIGQYKGTSAFSTWVFNIANNLLVDHIRKDKRVDVISVDGINYHEGLGSFGGPEDRDLFEIASTTLTPEQTTERDQYHALLHDAVNSNLSEKECKAVSLFYFGERTYDEITDEMAIPMGTVKVLLFRAKEKLERRFAK